MTERQQVFDQSTHKVYEINPIDFKNEKRDKPGLYPAAPPLIGSGGEAVYHPNGETHAIIRAALTRVEVNIGYNHTELPGLRTAVLYAPDPTAVTTDILLDAAAYIERDPKKKGSGQAEGLIGLALTIQEMSERKTGLARPHLEADTPQNTYEQLKPVIDHSLLSNGETFTVNKNRIAEQVAQKKVEHAFQLVEQPLTSVIKDIQAKMQTKLEDKRGLLNVATLDDEKRDLSTEIVALEANIRYCDVFIEVNATYETYEDTARMLTTQVQDKIVTNGEDVSHRQDVSISETELQAITSLKEQLNNAFRMRKNAATFLYGDGSKSAGLVNEAISIRKKELSLALNEEGVPLVNALASERLAVWIDESLKNKGIEIATESDLIRAYKETAFQYVLIGDLPIEERKRDQTLVDRVELEARHIQTLLDEIKVHQPELSIDSSGFTRFISETYTTSSEENPLNFAKANLWRFLSQSLDIQLRDRDLSPEESPIRSKYDRLINEVVTEVDKDDYIKAATIIETAAIDHQMSHNLSTLIQHISPENVDTFVVDQAHNVASVLLANYEIECRANDEHLNAQAVLLALADAKFRGKPVSLQTVRCLRWCYPNRVLEITPHAADWDTLSHDGSPSLRREKTDREKLVLFKRAVIDPVQHHNIPIKDVTLLAAGDYDLVGPGYGYTFEDKQPQNARAYVEDVKTRVHNWAVFGDLPVRVISFREMIESYGQDRFDEVLTRVQSEYDSLLINPRSNFVGYNAQELERLISAEHATRSPFIADWNRQRSRDLTRHKVCMELAIGVVLADQQKEYPAIVTVSGTQPAAKTFAKGHNLVEGITPLGITLFKSINDGDQPKTFAHMTTVVQ